MASSLSNILCISVSLPQQLPQILEKLLPGLLPLANKEELRPQVLVIVSNLVRRIRALQTQLPCPALLTKLVQPEMMPFACNITLTLLDIALPHEPTTRRQQCAEAVFSSVAAFYPTITTKPHKVFCMQLDALLNYALELLPDVPAAITSSVQLLVTVYQHLGALSCSSRPTSVAPPHPLALFWDFLLDLSLAQAPLIAGALGSVQPGLSQQRVQRLCHRARKHDADAEPSTGWFLPQLKQVCIDVFYSVV